MVLHRLIKLFSVILFAESVRSRGGINIWQHCYQIVDGAWSAWTWWMAFHCSVKLLSVCVSFYLTKRSEKMIKLNSFKT